MWTLTVLAGRFIEWSAEIDAPQGSVSLTEEVLLLLMCLIYFLYFPLLFPQSVFAAVAFFYSGYVLLMWQLLLMVVLGFTGTLCFFVVERMQNFSVDTQEY